MHKVAAAIFTAAGCLLTASASTMPTVYGFMLTDLDTSFYRGDEQVDCPDGRSNTVREAFLATQSAAEQSRLQKPENSIEFERKYKVDYVFGQGGKDICSDSDLFDTPDRQTQKLVQSKIAPGMDIDGAADGTTAPGTCTHDSFTSPSGEAGVDNQFFRAVACNTFWRGGETGVGDMLSGSIWTGTGQTAAVIVRDVQDWQNDQHVEVEIVAVVDKPAMDVKQRAVRGASLTVSSDPRYRFIVNGQIRDGLLTTDAADLVLPFSWLAYSGGEFIVRQMRLRIRYTADGDLVGEAGGYRPIDNAIAITHVGGPGVASAQGVECASVRKTLRLLADGDPNPKTKQCTSISSGMRFGAKSAFIFDRGVLINRQPDSE
jgi:hypothetical protein